MNSKYIDHCVFAHDFRAFMGESRDTYKARVEAVLAEHPEILLVPDGCTHISPVVWNWTEEDNFGDHRRIGIGFQVRKGDEIWDVSNYLDIRADAVSITGDTSESSEHRAMKAWDERWANRDRNGCLNQVLIEIAALTTSDLRDLRMAVDATIAYRDLASRTFNPVPKSEGRTRPLVICFPNDPGFKGLDGYWSVLNTIAPLDDAKTFDSRSEAEAWLKHIESVIGEGILSIRGHLPPSIIELPEDK